MTMPAQFPALQQRGLAKFIKLALDFSANETLDPRITFSRTSNATRTNAQGLIEYAPHNLLTNSENFDNASWVKNLATITPNVTVSPNGTTTADSYIATAVSGEHTNDQSFTAIAGNTYTGSCYVKAAGLTDIGLRFTLASCWTGGVSQQVRFNLATGTTTVISGTPVSYDISSEGNGWYRISMSAVCVAAGTPSLRLQLMQGSSNVFTGDGTSGIYIWGAQLNIGSLQPYYTTSVKNLLGYSQNFENAAWTKGNSNVLTNLLTYSQEFDNAVWIKGNTAISANAVTAPDGTTTADTLTGDGVATSHFCVQSYTYSAISYSYSIYLKKGTNNFAQVRFGGGAGGYYANFDLDAGIVGTTNATSFMSFVGNGWYKCTVRATTNASASNLGIFIVTSGSAAGGEINTLTTSINLWGAQLVQGTNPEEYTVTTSATAPIQVMGPLGFLGAEKLVENTTSGYHYIYQFYSGIGKYSFSFYAKAAERTQLFVDIFNGTDTQVSVQVNLDTGVSTDPSLVSCTSVGNGWYRVCAFNKSITSAGSTRYGIFLANAAGAPLYTGDGTSGIYIFGAQLSDSASLDPYVYNFGAAPTSSAYYGPRFDYDPVTLAPKGLLIEEQRINSIRNNTMQGAVVGTPGTLPTNYTYTGGGLAANVINIGEENGIKYVDIQFVGTATSGSSGLRFEGNTGVTASTGQTWNTSLYVRKISGTTSGISSIGTNLTYLIAGAVSDAITEVIPFDTLDLTSIAYNRQDVTLTAVTLGITTVRPQLILGHNIGANIDITLRIGMPQLEQGAFPTSVIPTTTTQVTRTADNASMVGTNFSSWYNQSEGTIYSEWMLGGDNISTSVYSISDGSASNLMRSRYNSAGTGIDNAVITSGATVAVLNATNQITTYSSYKNAMAYLVNDFARAANTVLVTDNSGAIPIVNQINIGASVGAVEQLNGHIQSIKYFNKRLLNSYLQSLTQ